jgi:hypothetical protein
MVSRPSVKRPLAAVNNRSTAPVEPLAPAAGWQRPVWSVPWGSYRPPAVLPWVEIVACFLTFETHVTWSTIERRIAIATSLLREILWAMDDDRGEDLDEADMEIHTDRATSP